MDTERLGLTLKQQAQIDDIFVDTTLQALSSQKHYWERAALVKIGDLADELESIHARTFDQAHGAIMEDKEIDPVITGLIGKLAFIDSLALPSSQVLGKKEKAERALGKFTCQRRLFHNLPHTS